MEAQVPYPDSYPLLSREGHDMSCRYDCYTARLYPWLQIQIDIF